LSMICARAWPTGATRQRNPFPPFSREFFARDKLGVKVHFACQRADCNETCVPCQCVVSNKSLVSICSVKNKSLMSICSVRQVFGVDM